MLFGMPYLCAGPIVPETCDGRTMTHYDYAARTEQLVDKIAKELQTPELYLVSRLDHPTSGALCQRPSAQIFLAKFLASYYCRCTWIYAIERQASSLGAHSCLGRGWPHSLVQRLTL